MEKKCLLKELTKSGKKIEKVNILNSPPIFPARSALLKSKQTRKKFQYQKETVQIVEFGKYFV